MVGVRLEVIVVGVVVLLLLVVVVVVVVVVVIILLCKKSRFLLGVFVCVWFTYLHQNKQKLFYKIIFNTFNLYFGKLMLASFQLLHYHLLTTILDKISICNNLQLL